MSLQPQVHLEGWHRAVFIIPGVCISGVCLRSRPLFRPPRIAAPHCLPGDRSCDQNRSADGADPSHLLFGDRRLIFGRLPHAALVGRASDPGQDRAREEPSQASVECLSRRAESAGRGAFRAFRLPAQRLRSRAHPPMEICRPPEAQEDPSRSPTWSRKIPATMKCCGRASSSR